MYSDSNRLYTIKHSVKWQLLKYGSVLERMTYYIINIHKNILAKLRKYKFHILLVESG